MIHVTDSSSGILYASAQLGGTAGSELLQVAVRELLAAVEVTPAPTVLWSVQYQQRPSSGSENLPAGAHILKFPPSPLDLAFDDKVLENVKAIWQKIVGEDAGEFLVFQDRESYDDE